MFAVTCYDARFLQAIVPATTNTIALCPILSSTDMGPRDAMQDQSSKNNPPPPSSSKGSAPGNAHNHDEEDDDSSPIVLPELKYGYRTEPLAWPELLDIVDPPPPREPNLDRLCRNRQQQYGYEVYKRRLKRNWRSMHDFVLCDKFDISVAVDTETGLKYANADATTTSTTSAATQKIIMEEERAKLVVVRNDFPYCLVPEVQHWVLWKLGGGPCTDLEIKQTKNEIRQRIAALSRTATSSGSSGDSPTQVVDVDFLHWINPPHLQSLPDIDHVHILCRCTHGQSSE